MAAMTILAPTARVTLAEPRPADLGPCCACGETPPATDRAALVCCAGARMLWCARCLTAALAVHLARHCAPDGALRRAARDYAAVDPGGDR